jgi:hypothetical protein
MSAADLDMSHGLVAGVWALVALVAFIGGIHFLTRPRSQTISGGFDVFAAVILVLAAAGATAVAVTV